MRPEQIDRLVELHRKMTRALVVALCCALVFVAASLAALLRELGWL